MSIKCEIDIHDLQILELLQRKNIGLVQNWDITIKEGVTLNIAIHYQPGDKLPDGAIEAVNECTGKVVKAFQLPTS